MMAWLYKGIAESVARRESYELARLLISEVSKGTLAGANIISVQCCIMPLARQKMHKGLDHLHVQAEQHCGVPNLNTHV